MVKEKIIDQLHNVLEDIGVETLHATSLQLDMPTDVSHGDYTTNIAFQLSKVLKKSPMQIAQDISSKLNEKPIDEIEKIEAVNPGFINFTLSKKELVRNMDQLLNDPKKIYTTVKTKEPKTIIVEYSSPNIAKPFTIGHLRSTIIGDAVANLLTAIGHDVKRDNHIGDWGTQFGKQIAALKFISLKDGHVDAADHGQILEENIALIENSDRPVKLLVDLYVKFHQAAEEKYPETDQIKPNALMLEDLARAEFKALETGNIQSRDLWQKCIDWSWKEFDAIYQQLGVSFTENEGRGFGESYFENKMRPVIQELTDKDMLQEGKEGAKIVEFPDKTKLPPLMILKKDGATLYATRDLATDKFRRDTYGDDIIIINEVGAEQSLYFQQLYELEAMLGWFKKGQRIHIKHGIYRFKEGKMSTRKGNVIWLEDVLSEAIERAFQLQKQKSEVQDDLIINESEKSGTSAQKHVLGFPQRNKLAKKVGVGAIKWNDLKRSSHMDIAFDWDDILNMQGNSGPYIQYSYARTQSILRKAEISQSNPPRPIGHSSQEEITQKENIPSVGGANEVEGWVTTPTSITESDSLLYNKAHYEIEEYRLLRQIYQFPERVQKAAETYSPNVICEYLFALAQEFNTFYQKHRILDASEESDKLFRLALTQAVGEVIKAGLHLLGIAAPIEM